MNDIYKSISILRKDALERGDTKLAIVYGCSLLRLQQEEINRKLAQLKFNKYHSELSEWAQFNRNEKIYSSEFHNLELYRQAWANWNGK